MEIHVMTRLLPKLLLLMLSAMFALPGHAENELAGYWQHESEPVWIEMHHCRRRKRNTQKEVKISKD